MRKCFVTLSLIAFLINGCATVQPTGFLEDYSKLKAGKYLDQYWSLSPNSEIFPISTLRLSSINIDRIYPNRGVTPKQSQEWLKNGLLKGVAHYLDDLKLNENSEMKAEAFLELGITKMTPGSSGGRMIAAELGLGHAIVQVEGKVIAAKTSDIIAVFSDLRRSSGMIGLQDLAGDAGPDLVRDLLEDIGADLIQEIQEDFKFEKIFIKTKS